MNRIRRAVRWVALVAGLLVLVASCTGSKGEGLVIYLLEGDLSATELRGLDLESFQLQDQPLVSGDDVVAYDWANHAMEVTDSAYQRVKALFTLPIEVGGIPFVVCVGRERIYTGALMSPASSLSYEGVVIPQPYDPEARVIWIGLAYPSPEAFQGVDPRSDARIQNALEAEGKLK